MLERTLHDLGISENQYKFQPHVLNIDVCILKGDLWTEVWLKKKKKQRKTSEEPNLTARKMDNYESDRPRNEFYNDSSY